MPLQATSGAASYDAFGGGVAAVPNYIEDYFSTFLYTGNNTSQTITNGIDLATKGGLVWIKSRAGTYVREHYLYDTARGTILSLSTDTTGGNVNNSPNGVSAYNTTGFDIVGSFGSGGNGSGTTYTSWSFAKAPKFFDVVTYTGDGLTGKVISHSLGSTPGCIIFKRTDSTSDWAVYHRSLNGGVGPEDYRVFLNTTAAQTAGPSYTVASVSSTSFTLGSNGAGGGSALTNVSGATYVAYVFAHNAGGFGLTGTDNVISCGSFTTDGSGNATVNLGYEPQWLLAKRVDTTGNWELRDSMRPWPIDDIVNGQAQLFPNLSNAESNSGLMRSPTATGFAVSSHSASATYIYIAIRRGPMKVPTSGTSVFNAITRTGTGAAATITGVGFAPDLVYPMCRNDIANKGGWVDKLRGASANLTTNLTDAESTNAQGVTAFGNTSISVGTSSFFNSALNYVNYFFVRAPGFMDEVCYTGTGSARTITHNLAAVPELMIVKCRSTARAWPVYAAPLGNTEEPRLNESSASGSSTSWNSTTPTSSVFSVSNGSIVNASGDTYVAYLFATCAGVSKVGSYTGTATTKQIDCGFTGGARFVLIKRTDSTGDWYVWDSARGIVSGNDPYLLLNSTAAEVTNTDYVDTYSAGFEISSTAPAAINASGGTFIFLAIA